MQKKALAAMTAVGLTAAIAIPTIAFGNARRDLGSFNFEKVANTPLTAKLLGANEVPPGDADGVGAAAVTIDINGPNTEVCWDLTYRNITGTPSQAGIRAGAAGANGALVIALTNLGPSSASGCSLVAAAVAQQILDAPQNFYVDIRTGDLPNGAIRGQLGAGPPPAGEAHMLASPLRAYDSRDNAGPKLAANETRTISPRRRQERRRQQRDRRATRCNGGHRHVDSDRDLSPPVASSSCTAQALVDPPATSSINWAGTNQNLAGQHAGRRRRHWVGEDHRRRSIDARDHRRHRVPVLTRR
jgi:hypothetical protein